MAFTVLRHQVTKYQMLCGSDLPVLFPLKSLSKSILYLKPLYIVVKLLIAALKNISYVCIHGDIFLQYLYDLLIVYVLSELH